MQKLQVWGRVLVAWHRPQQRYLWALGGLWSMSFYMHKRDRCQLTKHFHILPGSNSLERGSCQAGCRVLGKKPTRIKAALTLGFQEASGLS